MAITDEQKARLDVLGYPQFLFIGATSGQWPKQTFVNEGQAAFWMAGRPDEGRRRHMIRVDLHTGDVTEMEFVERVVERTLVPKE